MGTEELTIGELARRSGLTPKALRLYDRCDLLPPQRVDPFTGYRYYAAGQIGRARLIARLRSIGMGLEQIRQVADLPSADAARELRAWWLQEQADARTRADEVAALLTVLRRHPTMEEDTMTVTTENTTPTHAARSEQGPVRASQQDAHLIRDLPGGATLLAIADGFGSDDDFAARVLDTLARSLTSTVATGASDPLTALGTAWRSAVALLPTKDDARDVGAAVTAAVLQGDQLAIAHLGDVRLLVVHEGTDERVIEPVTRDHTYIASQVAAGRLTADEAAAHPGRATLNRALAPDAPTAPDLILRRVHSGQRVVLLSDGVHAVLDPSTLGEALAGPGTPADAVRTLTELTLAAGAPDNLSVLVADVP